MRLITHNMLQCNIRGVTNGFPFIIEADTVEVQEVEFDAEFIQAFLPKLDWEAFRGAAQGLELDALPEQIGEEDREDESFLRKVHHALLEVHVMEGHLVCPESGRKFPICKGIPNCLLHEDEL